MHTPTGCPSPLLHFIELCTNRPAILHDSTLLVQPSLGTVSDFVLGSYVLSSKPKTKSDTTHRSLTPRIADPDYRWKGRGRNWPPTWPPSWPPGPSCPRRSRPESWRWSRPPRWSGETDELCWLPRLLEGRLESGFADSNP